MTAESNEPKSRYLQYLEVVTGPLEDKRRYRRYKARIKRLPAGYRTAIDALERYMQFFGPGKADSLLAMLDDLADLFEQSAADGTPIREVVGEDPVEFAEAFLRNYPEGQWIHRERERLANAIDHAVDHVTGDEP
jgi:DNA-binding ferritin-like protein (Dps family)